MSEPISIIIPAYNEEGGVARQIHAVRDALAARDAPFEIVVVDDGSTDDTAAEAARAGARVLRHGQNRGYGAALKTGILASRHECIAITDADGTYPAHEIPALADRLEVADMVVGARTGSEVNMPLARRPAKWLLRSLAMYIAEQPIPDLNSGLRVFRRSLIEPYFPILSNRFSFTTTNTLALLADGYRVDYQPIDYYQRTGRSKIGPHHFFDFTILILRMSMMFQPLKIFVPLALVCGGLGTLKLVYDLFAVFLRAGDASWALFLQPTISTSAVLLLTVALQMLLIGMVADGLLRRLGHSQRAMPAPHVARDFVVTPAPETEPELQRLEK